jgi:putative hydrolase of the HAD superfamily
MENIHLFFDLDRTLWDFEKNSQMALKIIFKKHNLFDLVESQQEFINRYKDINRDMWRQFGAGKMTKEELRTGRFSKTLFTFGVKDQELADAISEDYLDYSPYQTNLFPGTIETLKELKKEGYKMHIITNGFKEVQEIKLEESKLAKFFDVVVCSEEVKESKPHPKVFEHAMKLAKVTPDHSVMIGDDYEVDYLGAVRAGMKAVLFNFRGMNKVRASEESIENLRELPARIPWLFKA